jgi:hypothetical protein
MRRVAGPKVGSCGLTAVSEEYRKSTAGRAGVCLQSVRPVELGAHIVNRIAFEEWLLGEHKA